MKPVLIIGCSKNKQQGRHQAIDLYSGSLFKQLKSHVSDPLEAFTVLILSAKHGLIKAETFISDYDERMPARTKPALVEDYCNMQRSSARKLLRSLANAQTDVFVVLTNDYLNAFDKMIEPKLLNAFRSCYICRRTLKFETFLSCKV